MLGESIQLMKWIKKLSLGIVGFLLLLFSIGFIYEQVSRVIAEGAVSPEGKMVDVGGHRLHVLSQGNAGPTVVFESGLDTLGHLSWFKVQSEVRNFATTVSYDRAGILWSERGEARKTGQAMAEDLHGLLQAGGFSAPYILVGHSLAGITLRPFIAKYGSDVAGVVLVDASHPEQFDRMPAVLNQLPARWFFNMMNTFGIFRFSELAQIPQTDPDDRINLVAPAMLHKSMSGYLDEIMVTSRLAEEARGISSFGDIPVVVITGTSPARNDALAMEYRNLMSDLWFEMQQELLLLSSDSRQILAPASGHYVQLEQPEIVVAAIRDLLFGTTDQ